MSIAGSNSNLTFVPPPVGVDFMGNELPADFGYDQGITYPVANNYGYFCTGFESPGEWGDQHNIFGLDGQDLHFLGVQADSLPYLYYTPNFGYAQSPYSQYTAYTPGAVTGDGPFIGTQQILNSSSYQPPVSSPTYIPILVQPHTDFVPANSADPFLFSTAASLPSRPTITGTKSKPSPASANVAASSRAAASSLATDSSQISKIYQGTSKPLEELQNSLHSSNQSSSQAAINLDCGTPASQGGTSVPVQSADYYSHGSSSFLPNAIKVAASSNNDFTNFVPSARVWATLDHYGQGLPYHGVPISGDKNPDVLGEQNRGPRTSRSKVQPTSSCDDVAEVTQKNACNMYGSIIINSEQYNKDDFPVDYPDAKFFVIKSYSEDDVHKSIKYNVWSSTPNGNKRLDSAYEDAQRISIGKPRSCPVFLFFSVNASGQFCGVAEMLGRVNFDKDMNFWHQDKWSGSFPVKWHIIKDVPNTSIRHIILENNENKPVTNSRDTQEIPYNAGINLLRIFKSSPLRTSILDDFMFYEERQKKILEDKVRHFGRKFNVSLYAPAIVVRGKLDGAFDQPQEVENQSNGKGQTVSVVGNRPDYKSDQIPKSKDLQDVISQPKLVDEKHSDVVDQPLKADGKRSGAVANRPPQASVKCFSDMSDHHPKAGSKNLSGVFQDEKQLKPVVDYPPKLNGKQSNLTTNNPRNGDIKPPTVAEYQPPKLDEKQSKGKIDMLTSADGVPIRPKEVSPGKTGPAGEQVRGEVDGAESSADKSDAKPDSSGDCIVTCPVKISGLLPVKTPEGKVKSLGTICLETTSPDVVKVGSVNIKVKGLVDSSSGGFSVGTGPVEAKGAKLIKKGVSAVKPST